MLIRNVSECTNFIQLNLSSAATQKEHQKFVFNTKLLFNAGQKYCRMLQRKHSAILSTFIKLPFVIKIFVLSIFEWPLKTGFTVSGRQMNSQLHKSLTTL